MIKASEKLDILRKNNPFASSSVGDPWTSKYPDVESINKDAFDGLRRLIGQKTQDPVEPLAGLVLGEAGSGKTHLIARILEHSKQKGSPFSFAFIPPIQDPEETYGYLLREAMVNLCRPVDKSSASTQLDKILGKIFLELIEKLYSSTKEDKFKKLLDKLRKDPTYIFRRVRPTQRTWEGMERRSAEWIMKQFPDMEKELLKVLFQYRNPKKRLAAVMWLKGLVLDEEESLMLGLKDRLRDSPASLEEHCRYILRSLGILMARYGRPLVVCFDQLENLETDLQVRALGKMVEFLVNEAKAMLPLAFLRGNLWEESFRTKLNQHVIQRLESNRISLKGCTREQALEIIERRLEFVFGENQAKDLFPLDKKELMKTFKAGLFSPRDVISLANQRLSQKLGERPPAVSPIEKLKREFETLYKTMLSDPEPYQPDRHRLRGALELYLANNPAGSGYEIQSLQRPTSREKHVDFQCKISASGSQPFPAIFLIDTQLHHSSVAAALKKGISFLESHASGKAFYIRDKRCPFPPPPRWPATNKILDEFKARGGRVTFLDQDQAAAWYALELLKYAVNSRDVTIIDSNNRMRAVTFEELARFIGEKIHAGKFSGFQALDEHLSAPSSAKTSSSQPRSHTWDDTVVAQKAAQILRPLPMMMITSQKLTDSLIQSGISIDLRGMLKVIGKFKDRFEVIPTRDEDLIMLKKRWAHAQS